MASGRGPLRFWTSRRTDGEQSGTLQADLAMLSTPALEEELRQLDVLNAALASLADIFPDVQPEVFREMLGTFPEDSRLHVVTETLLKHKAKWVKGRWKVPDSASTALPSTQTSVAMPKHDRKDKFRSRQYRDAVKTALYEEFKGLTHSSIKAVLAEHNHSYLHTRTALLRLAATSWRYSFTNFISRRKAPDAGQCPLISWRGPSAGLEPSLIPTTSAELNEELVRHFIAPAKAKRVQEQITADAALAAQLNEDHAVEEEACYDCECCFSSYSFERIATCASGDHVMCFTCIHHTMTEALYGQGWGKSVDADKMTLRCIAAGSGNECQSRIPQSSVKRALEITYPQDFVWNKFEERAARETLSQSRLSLRQCPHCFYAEAIDVPRAPRRSSLRFDQRPFLVLVTIICILIMSLIPLLGIPAAVCAAYFLDKRIRSDRLITAQASLARSAPNYGQKFICRNPSCQRISCLRCSSPWVDIHVCHESSRQALRTYIESAVTDSIKRTCPKCNLSFVKSSGCNKLVCVCGYSMCYVCRQDVGKDGYAHFCPHFRVNPGDRCRECTRCDLYKTEDDDEVMARAKDKAVEEWKEQMLGKEGAEDVLASLEGELMETTARPRSRDGQSWFAAFRR